uniref:Uncharacterized protein n=1 Tax=Lygus hesperus TaxID=30085 RepID=A0A0A9YI07_LYGHE
MKREKVMQQQRSNLPTSSSSQYNKPLAPILALTEKEMMTTTATTATTTTTTNTSTTDKASRGDDTYYLDESDLNFLHSYENYTRSLLNTALTDDVINLLKLT